LAPALVGQSHAHYTADMRPALSDRPSQHDDAPGPWDQADDAAFLATASINRQPRNFAVMVAYQVLMRTGWIFKTESVIMPSVLDTLGFGAWLRGCLPTLNRVAQSLSPLLMARPIKILPRKKSAVAVCTLVMGAAFLALAAVWPSSSDVRTWRLPIMFLGLYTIFFVCNGVNQMAVSTLQGKLIRITHRGRLLLVSNTAGAATAIVCALCLLPLWLQPEAEDSQFARIFGFAGACFAAAAACSLLLAEPPDRYREAASSIARVIGNAWSTLREDANFRRLTVVSMLFSASLTLFPHYQALGRGDRMQHDLTHLLWWVVVQNAGTALFSLLFGPLADRRGNRLVLRVVMLGLCGAPLAAVALSHVGPAGRALFPLVFLLVGLTPIGIKTFHYYTLEIASPEDHPRYLATLSVCSAAPLLLSPFVGLLIDIVGRLAYVELAFDAVFVGVAVLVFAGCLMTFGLREPRRRLPSAAGATAISDGA